MTAKKRGRVIIGWRQVVPPKVRAPKAKTTAPAPGVKVVPNSPVAERNGSADEADDAVGS